MADEDPLNRRVVEQMLVGVATRPYARSLDPLPSTTVSRGTNKSTSAAGSSRRPQLTAWRSTALDAIDLPARHESGSFTRMPHDINTTS